ncbi:acyltransferase [Streptomyces goshikiensis]|uniref:acyltransferase n=1 Tax=Streptomyces goshikiensis TaxID=1942 RepID=UPI0037A47A83
MEQHHPIELTARQSVDAVRTVTGETLQDLGEILRLRNGLVSRRQRGLISWRLDDLGRLADHWGIPYQSIFAGPEAAVSRLSTDRLAEIRRSLAELRKPKAALSAA